MKIIFILILSPALMAAKPDFNAFKKEMEFYQGNFQRVSYSTELSRIMVRIQFKASIAPPADLLKLEIIPELDLTFEKK